MRRGAYTGSVSYMTARHPLLRLMAEGAHWRGRDEYPTLPGVADEHERWLEFLDGHGQLPCYLPRLRGPIERRDDTLAEIAVGYFLERWGGLPIIEWAPVLANGKRGEFLVRLPGGGPLFIEVKSPSWRAEIARARGQGSPRLLQPRYIHAEGGSTAPWRGVRDSVRRASGQTPGTMPTMLVINDNLFVPLNNWPLNVEIALYCPRGHGTHPAESYLAEDGCFVSTAYELIGAVGVLNIDRYRTSGATEYSFKIYDNPRCLEAVAVPQGILEGYERTDGSLSLSH